DDDDHFARGTVFVYSTAGVKLGAWNLDANNGAPSGITLNPAGGSDLWVVDRHDAMVYRYAGATARRAGSQSAADRFRLTGENHHPEGIADPPALSVTNPADGTTLPAGQTLVITGQAIDGTGPASSVRVDGQAVDALDAAGNFFHRVQVAPGTNAFTVTASDS